MVEERWQEAIDGMAMFIYHAWCCAEVTVPGLSDIHSKQKLYNHSILAYANKINFYPV